MRKANRRTAPDLIASREEFEASALSARWDESLTLGRLPDEYAIQILTDRDGAGARGLYVVYSYWTPIAWFDGETWTIPDVKYSPTTSRHQNIVRHGVSLGPTCRIVDD
jgi:hypothetical protein